MRTPPVVATASSAHRTPLSTGQAGQAQQQPVSSSFTNARGLQTQLPTCALRADEKDVSVPVGSPLENARAVGRFEMVAQGSEASVQNPPGQHTHAGAAEQSPAQGAGGSASQSKYGAGAQASLFELQQRWTDAAESAGNAGQQSQLQDAALSRHDARSHTQEMLPSDDLHDLADDLDGSVAQHGNGTRSKQRDVSASVSKLQAEQHALQRKGWHSRLGSDAGSAITSSSSQFWWT